MASSWNRLLTVYLLGLWMPVWGSALTRERFFGRIELCSEVFPGTSSFPDVSKMHCATKCAESEACTAFSFTTTSGICHLHYDSDLTSYPCTTSSSTSQHFEKISENLVCYNGGSIVSDGTACKCVNGYVGSRCERLAKDCKEIIASGYYDVLLHNIFNIRPSLATAPIRVLCDSWVENIIHKRISVVPSFNRSMADYVAGFGDANSDYWVGLQNLYLLTSSTSYTLGVQVAYSSSEHQRFYRNFTVRGAGNGYSMFFGGQYDPPSDKADTMGDCLSQLQNSSFSTYDADMDGNATYNCANNYGGGWWYNQQCSDCNLVGKKSQTSTRIPGAVDELFWNPGLDSRLTPVNVYMFLFRS
ncbi:hypothetical protein C0Q70_00815 [Pomacea canaliculata]|uniref:Fibrinogen C-terminal domain-containing protein n=1 Tax=Pomacea canaliculata TaxID=400727 RepID=A0A2T7PXQ6_POMCA|nr:microfibril-associated glycoprotein 4-like [Pomacea canaliculata]PVD38204.1 hypothetical protein C0Q70_00815 [Pomacea canaliculata]